MSWFGSQYCLLEQRATSSASGRQVGKDRIRLSVIFGNSYMVETMQGERLPMALNGRYLKKYYPAYGETLEDEDGWYRVSPLALFLALYFLCRSMYLG